MSEDQQARPWFLQPTTLLLLAILGGTGIGGGGATALLGTGDTDTSREIAELRTEVTLLRGAVEGAQRQHAAAYARLEKRVDDHEGRLREIERGNNGP